jgi:hypothetical protein
MRTPSKRTTFLLAFLVTNFLLWFPFADTVGEDPSPAEPQLTEEKEPANELETEPEPPR